MKCLNKFHLASYINGWFYKVFLIRGDLPVREVEGGHQCLLCGKVIKHFSNFKRHVLDKHNESGQIFVCRFCQKEYKSKNSMETHQYLYHKEEMKSSMGGGFE